MVAINAKRQRGPINQVKVIVCKCQNFYNGLAGFKTLIILFLLSYQYHAAVQRGRVKSDSVVERSTSFFFMHHSNNNVGVCRERLIGLRDSQCTHTIHQSSSSIFSISPVCRFINLLALPLLLPPFLQSCPSISPHSFILLLFLSSPPPYASRKSIRNPSISMFSSFVFSPLATNPSLCRSATCSWHFKCPCSAALWPHS